MREVGIAGGLSGVVAFAALAHRLGSGQALLSEATGALLAHAAPPRLPSAGGRPRRSAATWSDGEVGIAAALSLAARLVTHPLVLPARTRALRAVPRHPSAGGGQTLDLHSGLAGVTHALQTLALNAGCEGSWELSGRWARSLLARLEAGQRCRSAGFIHGTAGVVLALLALTTDLPPLWNRALLLA